MNIAIITIHNVSNYGAVLQSFALKEVISSKYTCSVIDFDNRHVSKSLDYIRVGTSIHALLGTLKDILRILPRFRVVTKFKKFISNRMGLMKYDVKYLSQVDVVISGSDQIWNPSCISKNKTFIPEYFLNFASSEQKKISYASSCGSYSYNPQEKLELKKFLCKYDALSTREKETSEYLQKLTGKDFSHVLDPTLLLSRSEWLERFEVAPVESGEYILLYVIKKTSLLKKTIKKIKKYLDVKVVLINQGLYFDTVVDKHIRDAGPNEFINLYNNAKFVVTDSFHGTTFSVIFNKPFLSVSPGLNINRISSLLDLLELQDRIIYKEKDIDQISDDSYMINFSKANDILESEKVKSKDFIFRNIEKIK